jgi:DNA-binding transcriptional regulator YhcF (GntR family)
MAQQAPEKAAKEAALQGAATADLSVDREDELPVGVQLAWRLRGMIAGGRLAAGGRLPSVRELSDLAGVHVNTVRSVYGQLEEEGLIDSRQGLGTFVSERTLASAELQRIAAAAVEDALESGLDPHRVAAAVYAAAAVDHDRPESSPARTTSTPLPDLEREGDQRAVRRELRRQIGHLEAELAAYTRDLPRPEPEHPLLAPKAHVADVAELEAIRNGLLEQLADARGKSTRRGKSQQRARAHREEMARDPERHKWQWVSNEETGEPACGTWRVTPRYGPLGALMGWWRVKVSSGCPLSGTG